MVLKLLPRCQRNFAASCERVRCDRDKLAALLAELPEVTAYPPDANYVMVQPRRAAPTGTAISP
ncbi:hypothetical protein SAMN05192558_1012 [Actinokineospora alba]|uniref:Uncharacterized protein n=1 Tax=Actinokineospora alba TaxID=504798 RepID=A0A1H0ELU3_9PSEU|nr:hypothetical protein [Actinokineospora alba]SDI23726.1 hypothetical protein SAMN05421871_103867 [Actinokineospora alba]SDN83259.1 hypothetical protein SAMN05192558_1012 [Actinokineospora alba]